MDEYESRIEVRASDRDGQVAIGWEVKDAADLAELVGQLRAAGFEVSDGSADGARERLVSGYAALPDPDGLMDIELVYGFKSAGTYFASPLGHRFVAGRALGLGHVFQAVTDQARHEQLYVDIFGFRLSDHIDFASGRVGTFLHCNPRHHSIAFAPTADQPLLGHLMDWAAAP